MSELRYSVLGPVRAWRGGEELELGSPQQRAVLAVLLLREGRPATADALIEAVWGDDPPRTAVLTLRTYVSRLRKVLGDETIRTVGGGYALLLGPDALDAAVHARSVADALARGDAAALAGAEALWQGEPLADVAGAWAEGQRVRLLGQRQAAVRERIALDITAGRPGAAVAELTGLVAAHPLDEGLRGLLMTALSRSGRQALAVKQYHEIRTLLAEELGLDPSPDLQRAYQDLLQTSRPPASAALEPLSAGRATASRPPARPAPPTAPPQSAAPRPPAASPPVVSPPVVSPPVVSPPVVSPPVVSPPVVSPPVVSPPVVSSPAASKPVAPWPPTSPTQSTGPWSPAASLSVASWPAVPSVSVVPARLPAPLAVPAQLPAPVRDFVGRAELLDRLSAVLTRDPVPVGPAGSACVVGIVGIGGAGSSALAVHVAHRIRPAFPDGQLYADLRGSDAGGKCSPAS